MRFSMNTNGGEAVSTGAKGGKQLSGCWMIGFFGIFFFVGMGMCVFMTILPVYWTFHARNWIEVPCKILSAEVERHSDSDGSDTYSIEVTYRYTVDGTEHIGDHYNFDFGSSSGRSGKQNVVDELNRNRDTVCYVDPDDPSQAILNRNIPTVVWFGFISVPFILVGAGGLLAMSGVFSSGKANPNSYQWDTGDSIKSDFRGDDSYGGGSSVGTSSYDDDWPSDVSSSGEVTLKPEGSPLGSFIGCTLLAIFWNGIVSVFLFGMFEDLTDGKIEFMDIFLVLFMTPFVLVGVALIVGIGYTFMALFNPRPTLTVSNSGVALGDTFRVRWKFTGNTNSIRQLKIFLHGQEQASYTRGTNTYTDNETFAKLMLIDTTNFVDIATGDAELTIPSDTMHSFSASDNKIIWSLELSGDIAWWPDVNASFPFTVYSHEK